MPKVAVYNKEGATVGEITLSDAVFGAEVNPGLLHEVVQMYLANKRQGTADTKTRAEVSGGGRKPWRQKGTGRARHGSIRSPLWRKGGIVFGPHPREYGWSMPKKARRAALRQALSAKVKSGELIVVDKFELEAPKTREVATLLKNLKVDGSAFIVTAQEDVNIYKSARNIPGVRVNAARNLNAYDVLAASKLVFTQDAVAKVEEVLG
ncbi:50S ribosomal protein L4 [Symbiobacterium thermophilum]|uniref:Large ribosomal subunit protein uL4 n=1 Tax=Symbiobacterium thermophilum (strain DSM 24528 / JCM 14929 / IAM 14863 / T) TaxID=292459 RepID=RL4_SYMTH|nr:50S ribosomal protein L4 [Symbiobacterium thermophilum]Q67JU4.1 RecName: Full=Large ribosomal subunit protein uL4; AltName: Full=50S ribosomal protein L4 [Symbiobacterium thermophilum IAM 14863]BAD42056.1 50S ribosomal protein L4 [Symbiobacterium thermophilum IAM 14863]